MTVYAKRNRRAYNFGMLMTSRKALVGRTVRMAAACVFLMASVARPQQQQQAGELFIVTKELPAAGLWNRYSARMESNQGGESCTWRLVGGALPRNLELRDSGLIEGAVNQQGTFNLLVEASRNGVRTKPKRFTLEVETPLKVDWSRKSKITGNRIDGAIKISNTTGRDFDLTFVVLAVAENGRATAIGYQHFPLKKNTRDMELPFGDTLAPGNYAVNIDVVAEEPVSKMIFRSRLVAEKQTIAPVL